MTTETEALDQEAARVNADREHDRNKLKHLADEIENAYNCVIHGGLSVSFSQISQMQIEEKGYEYVELIRREAALL